MGSVILLLQHGSQSAFIAVALTSTMALAASNYDESKVPIFLEPGPDRALVYIVRSESPKLQFIPSVLKVFLDQTPIGYLRCRSYLVSHVEPGTRVITSSIEGRRTPST